MFSDLCSLDSCFCWIYSKLLKIIQMRFRSYPLQSRLRSSNLPMEMKKRPFLTRPKSSICQRTYHRDERGSEFTAQWYIATCQNYECNRALPELVLLFRTERAHLNNYRISPGRCIPDINQRVHILTQAQHVPSSPVTNSSWLHRHQLSKESKAASSNPKRSSDVCSSLWQMTSKLDLQCEGGGGLLR
jgi:hypothetical protein